jgi:DNA-binding beta-propeller fold protein YncE
MHFARLTCAAALLIGTSCAPAQDKNPLKQIVAIDMTGVEGRFDHFAADPDSHRLFVAALGNNTLETIDTANLKRLHSQTGLQEPQGVVFIPHTKQVVVASGNDGMLRAFDAAAADWKLVGKIEDLDDADNVRYDPAAKRIYVGYGKGALAVVDAQNFRKIADVKLDAHPESFQLEQQGNRIFVNVTSAGHIAVIDREKLNVIAKWPVKSAAANFPMTLDEKNHRLMIACRKPAKMLVIDTQSGNEVAAVDCIGDADDLFYDPAARRIYITGGEGAIDTIAQTDPDHYTLIARTKTAPGARTGWFISAENRLYVAVPHRGQQKAEIRVFDTRSAP